MATKIHGQYIVDGAITTAKLANDAVGSAQLADNAVGADALANNAVDSAAIVDDAVTAAKIADGAVVAAAIAGDAIDGSKIADNAIANEHLGDSVVNTAELAASAVTAAKADIDGTNGNWDFSAGVLRIGGAAVATQSFVNDIVEGLDPKPSVHAATTEALPACTYNNGSSGVGATLTGNANGAFPTIDGVAASANNLYIIKNQAAALQNGWYKLTTVGDGSTAFVLTRMVEADESGDLSKGAHSWVEGGTTNGQKAFYCTAAGVIGSDAVTISLYHSAIYSASTGIQKVNKDFRLDFANTNPSLEIADGGVRAKTDESTIERAAGGLQVKDLGVTTAKIAADAITSAKVAAAAITTAKIAADAVDKAKIAADVAGSGLSQAGDGALDVSVDNSTIEVSSDSLRLKDAGITSAKLASAVKTRIGGGWDAIVKATGDGSAVNVDLGHSDASLTEESLLVTIDGLVMELGGSADYTTSDNGGSGGVDRIVFVTAPANGSRVIIRYRRTSL